MNGIDIARYQKGIDLSVVPCDFVIVKATEGTSYVSPTFNQQITDAMKNNKLIGVYHYGSGKDAVREAEHFVKTCNALIGKAILVLDWESAGNRMWNKDGEVGYVETLLEAIYTMTGVQPILYIQKSVIKKFDYLGYPLWIAQYANKTPTGYQISPWNEGAYKCLIRQYTSAGRLKGYSKNLDLDKAYCTRDEWIALASGNVSRETSQRKILAYEAGKTYTLTEEMNVRVSPSTTAKKKTHSMLTLSGRKHDLNKNGQLDKGTVITCKEVRYVGEQTWVRCPSGWICAVGSKGKVFVR